MAVHPLRTAIAAVLLLAAAVALRAATTPQVAITRLPAGIAQAPGGTQGTDSFTIANAGPGTASITLVAKGSFFTVNPSSLNLDAGATATISITLSTAAAGFNEGSVSVFVSGNPAPLNVPVRAFITEPPAGPGVITYVGPGTGGSAPPVTLAQTVVVYGAPGVAHQAGVAVSNPAAVTIQGALIPGASWIVPKSGLQTIPPNTRAQLPFLSEPTQRPDAAFPLGATVGTTSFVYLNGNSANGVAQTGTLTMTVFDISKVSPVPTEPPPAAPGEVINFVPLTQVGFFTDVFLSNRARTGLSSDLKLFFTALGASPASSLLSNVGKLPSGSAAWFPFALTSLFNLGTTSGTMQVRTAEPDKVTVAAIRGVVPDGINKYLTWMPIIRSDRGIPAGNGLVLSGVEKSAAAHTDIFIQEVAGYAGAYTIDFFGASGAQIPPSVSGTVLPFGYTAVGDAVPPGAVSARLSNSSSGTARLQAYGAVVDERTFDTYIVVDSSRDPAPTSDLVLPLPLLTGTPAATTFDAWITNTSAGSAQVVVSTSAPAVPPSRQHSVRRRGGTAPISSDPPIVFAAGETRRISLTTTPLGYVRISGPAGALSASGRLTSSVQGRAGSFGTGVPAIPAARALGTGALRRYERANDTPNLSPPTLLMIEVAGKPATVRVTAGFSFPAGALVSGQQEISKDYQLAAGQRLAIPDLVRSLYGPSRDSLGVLSNLVVNVEVISGGGKVLSYLQTIDPSGDLVFSSE